MHSLFVMDKVLRDVFTENLQTQAFIFTGTFCINPVETQHSKNFSLSFIFDMFKSSLLGIRRNTRFLRNTTTSFKEYNNYPHWFITQVFNDVDKIFNQ